MTAPIKNPTAWRPPSGQGTVVLIGMSRIVVNSNKLPIVKNGTTLPVLTNASITKPKHVTTWTEMG